MTMRDDGTPNDPRAIPGGTMPSRTPGATGPSTREIGRGNETDATDWRIRQMEIVGRVEDGLSKEERKREK
ncbi:MAG TPA: hypothetical protein VK886_00480 [Vicinamibacterales bacterium]|nr:hypothetical protein [Vicinamibacterales bacterium]